MTVMRDEVRQSVKESSMWNFTAHIYIPHIYIYLAHVVQRLYFKYITGGMSIVNLNINNDWKLDSVYR